MAAMRGLSKRQTRSISPLHARQDQLMPEAWAQSRKKGPGKYGVEYPCLEVPVHSFVPKVVTHLQPCHISTVTSFLGFLIAAQPHSNKNPGLVLSSMSFCLFSSSRSDAHTQE